MDMAAALGSPQHVEPRYIPVICHVEGDEIIVRSFNQEDSERRGAVEPHVDV